MDSPDGLRKQFSSDVLYELESSDLIESLRVVSSIPGVKDSAVFGKGLHIRVGESSIEEAIRDNLRQAGIKILKLNQTVPSIEDIFVSRIEEEENR
jgi:ABC-2 type transport system ATP-binding protein